MSRSRWMIVVFVMALCLAVIPASLAQDTTFGASQDDFALWTQGNGASGVASSFSYSFKADLTVSGVGQDVGMNLTGSGVIGGTETEPLFSMLVGGTLVAEGETIPADLEVRLIGQNLYLRLGEMGWMTSTLEELMGMASSMGGSMMPVDPTEAASGDLSELMAIPGLNEALMGLMTLDPTKYISLERLEDRGSAAHFSLNIALGQLLASPEMSGLIGAAAGMAQMGNGAEMSSEEMSQMGAMVGMLFSSATISLEQFISAETNLVEQAIFTLNLPLPAMMTGSDSGLIKLVFDISLSGYNQPVALETPANAQPMSEMMGMMMGM